MSNDLLDRLLVIPRPSGFNPGAFDCGEKDLNDYLSDGSVETDSVAGLTCCYLVMDEDELVGYFAILADAIRLKPKERPENVRYGSAPAIKLGRMGVCTKYRGKAVGSWILQYVTGMARSVAKTVGVRYVTLDALPRDTLIAWYQRNGFVPNHGEAEKVEALLRLFGRWKADKDPKQTSMRLDLYLESELPEPD